MATVTDLVLDYLSGFNHKSSMDETNNLDGLVPFWSPQSERRRLRGYLTAYGYHETVARNWLPPASDDLKKIWREWGDAPALSDRISAATLGDDITILVVGADDDLPDSPLLLPEPPEPVGDLSNVARRNLEARRRVWEAAAERAIGEWELAHTTQPRLRARQRDLRRWAHDQRFEAKLREAETELITPLGDAVFVLSVRPGEAPTVRIWEPDAYFPVFPDAELVDFPDKVHLAYEYLAPEPNGTEERRWLRRVTYEIVEGDDEIVYPYRDAGQPVRSHRQCIMSDGTWPLGDISNRSGTLSGLDNLDESQAVWADSGEFDDDGEPIPLRDFPLGIHFMPVVHAPSDLATLTHFGRSIYARWAQILDEIAQNDTASGRAADMTGLPILSVQEGRLDTKGQGKVTYEPGTILEGKIAKIEMADALAALDARGKSLRRHLSSVAAVPEGILGQVQANQLASGISILLTFTPFRQLITRRRLARKPKVDLMLEFVQRLGIVSGHFTDPNVYDASVEFGSYIPTDLSALVEIIVNLADRGLMTESLAMTLIQSAGLEMGDIEVLVAELQSRRVEDAAALVEIAGREYALRFLGINPADADEPDPEPERVEVPDLDSQRPDPAGVRPL